jgi:hypothetical protein
MNTHPRHVLRRSLLRGSLFGALAAPFVKPARAQAAAPALPNLVVVTWPVGLERGWQPTGTESSWQLGDVLAPMNAFRDKLTVVEGIKCGSNNIILEHSEGTLSMWTGDAPTAFQNLAKRASFEQLVATKIGTGTPYKSLHFGAQTNRKSAISNPYVHYAGSEQPIPAEDDPSASYKLIFGGLSNDGAALDRLRAERRSVLDFATARLRALTPKIAAEDRPKLEKHADAIREVEKGLDGLSQRCGATLAAPTLTAAAAVADANFPAVIKLQTDLLATALQCGVTRVATLQLSNTDSQTKIPGLVTQRGVHEAMHSGTADERVEVNRFFGKQLAYVLQRLAAVDVGGGRTLLDDTMVVMSTEMSIGPHGFDPVPFFLGGNGAGALKIGRYVKLPSPLRFTKALTSILHAYGASDAPTFGGFTDAESQGELTQLHV